MENDKKDRESEKLEKQLQKLAKQTEQDKNRQAGREKNTQSGQDKNNRAGRDKDKQAGQKRRGRKGLAVCVAILAVAAVLILAGYFYLRPTGVETEVAGSELSADAEPVSSGAEQADVGEEAEPADAGEEAEAGAAGEEFADAGEEALDAAAGSAAAGEEALDAAAETAADGEEAEDAGAEADDVDTTSEDRELSGWAAAAVAAKEFREAAAADDIEYISLDDIPAYSGSPYVFINGNQPFFTDSDYTTEVFETYSDLDELGRCGPAYANLCKELMPTGNREYIRNIYPSGYHNTKYSFIDGGYVYNRCHLIAFSLAGESANEKNLITGTEYLNIDGMYPFEYMVGDYIRRRNNHVLYRVTPVFEGDNLVASGVLIEASSVEDKGEGLNFCVYCYNVQPGVAINYATGRTQSDGTMG